ncbi:MAG: hypothetical protein JO316_24680 [Abitibacteriaceae bacterium]|nr:hypothetical protein [Abditibacteriaceae bacterium]
MPHERHGAGRESRHQSEHESGHQHRHRHWRRHALRRWTRDNPVLCAGLVALVALAVVVLVGIQLVQEAVAPSSDGATVAPTVAAAAAVQQLKHQ